MKPWMPLALLLGGAFIFIYLMGLIAERISG